MQMWIGSYPTMYQITCPPIVSISISISFVNYIINLLVILLNNSD